MSAVPNIADFDFFAQARQRIERRAQQAREILADLAPPLPRGLVLYEWSAGIDEVITCHLEYTEAEEAQHYGDAPHPGAPENMELCAAYLKGVDIFPLLSELQRDEIETLALIERGES